MSGRSLGQRASFGGEDPSPPDVPKAKRRVPKPAVVGVPDVAPLDARFSSTAAGRPPSANGKGGRWVTVAAAALAVGVVAWLLWPVRKTGDPSPRSKTPSGHVVALTMGDAGGTAAAAPQVSVSPRIAGSEAELADASQRQVLTSFSSAHKPLCVSREVDHRAAVAAWVAREGLHPHHWSLLKRLATTARFPPASGDAGDPVRQAALWLTPYGLLIAEPQLGSKATAGVHAATPLDLTPSPVGPPGRSTTLPAAWWNWFNGRLTAEDDDSWPFAATTADTPVLWRLASGGRELQFLSNGELRLVQVEGGTTAVLWTASSDARDTEANTEVHGCA